VNKAEAFLSIDVLRQLIDLDSETGSLRWLPRPPFFFKSNQKHTSEHRANNWNSRYAWTPALACVDKSGHLFGRIFDHMFFAHRVVFALMNGHWPVNSVDHINGVPADNRISNLRDVTHKENMRNQKRGKANTSGHIGVSANKRLGKWAAHITVNGQQKHLGFHEQLKDAVNARLAAEKVYGFHDNHGR